MQRPIREYNIGDRVQVKTSWNETVSGRIITKEPREDRYERRVAYTIEVSADFRITVTDTPTSSEIL